jgi:hypothetical protein
MYNDENTVRTVLAVVDVKTNFKNFPVLKSTDTNLPEGLTFKEEDGTLKKGVKEEEGLFGEGLVQFAFVQSITTTLDDVMSSKSDQFTQSARSDIKGIDPLAKNAKEQKGDILLKLSNKNKALEDAETLQDAESIVWVGVDIQS